MLKTRGYFLKLFCARLALFHVAYVNVHQTRYTMIDFVADSDVTLASFVPKRYISMDNNAAIVSGQQTQFQLVRPGLTQAPDTVSIMSVAKPGWFLRHYGYRLYLEPIANPRNPGLFAKDSTFTERSDAFLDGFTAFQSVNYPDYYISFDTWQQLSIRRFENTNVFKESASFAAITGNRYIAYIYPLGAYS